MNPVYLGVGRRIVPGSFWPGIHSSPHKYTTKAFTKVIACGNITDGWNLLAVDVCSTQPCQPACHECNWFHGWGAAGRGRSWYCAAVVSVPGAQRLTQSVRGLWHKTQDARFHMTANTIGDGCDAAASLNIGPFHPLLLPSADAVAFLVSRACHVVVVVMVT